MNSPIQTVRSLGLLLPVGANAVKANPAVETYTYKRVGPLEIKANVNRASDDGCLHPVVVWIHGGALMMGGREHDTDHTRNLLLGSGHIVVSIDYRLAPETKLPEIIEDVVDAFRWIREQGPALFKADPERIAVMGGSAGGYLTLVAGYEIKPRPLALVSFWGYGDLVGPWLSQPSKELRHQVLKLTREEAWQLVSGPPVANAKDRKESVSGFYQYCRLHGLWPKAVAGWDPRSETEKFYPYLPLKNITRDYPPTLLIHGQADTDVPHEQSVRMAAEFERQGVEHRFISVPNGEHALDGADARVVETIQRDAAEFLRNHLEAPAAASSAPP